MLRRTVPYDMAIDRVLERLADIAAPMVPDDSANAADVKRYQVHVAHEEVFDTDLSCSYQD